VAADRPARRFGRRGVVTDADELFAALKALLGAYGVMLFGRLVGLRDLRLAKAEVVNLFANVLDGLRDGLPQTSPVLDQLRDDVEETSLHVKQSRDHVKQSRDHVKESRHDLEKSSQYVKQSSQYVEKSSQYVKQSSQRRSKPRSVRSEPRAVRKQLLHRRQ